MCRSIAKIYLKRGLIKRGPCVVCGDLKSEMHHPDYDLPLEKIDFCRKHHRDLHAALGPSFSGYGPFS